MSEEINNEVNHAQSLILALNEARQKEIESVRSRMEDFLKGQLDLQHKMDIVSEGQKALKERFEEGVSKRLTGLDGKMDRFLMEWGSKQKEDELRDKRLADVDKKSDAADTKATAAFSAATFYGRAILVSVLGSVLLMAIVWLVGEFHG